MKQHIQLPLHLPPPSFPNPPPTIPSKATISYASKVKETLKKSSPQIKPSRKEQLDDLVATLRSIASLNHAHKRVNQVESEAPGRDKKEEKPTYHEQLNDLAATLNSITTFNNELNNNQPSIQAQEDQSKTNTCNPSDDDEWETFSEVDLFPDENPWEHEEEEEMQNVKHVPIKKEMTDTPKPKKQAHQATKRP